MSFFTTAVTGVNCE